MSSPCGRRCGSGRWSSGFSLVDQTKIVTAASELARNTMQYGGGGTVRIEGASGRRRDAGCASSSRTTGPGIADIELAMKDGFTTGGGLGLGLSGAKRLSNEFADRLPPGEGHPRHHRPVAMNVTRGLCRRGGQRSCRSPPRGVSARPAARASPTRAPARSRSIVTELATNLAKHATGGEILLRRSRRRRGGRRGVEIVALDRGRAIPDVALSRASTATRPAGRSATGLGAVERQSDFLGDLLAAVRNRDLWRGSGASAPRSGSRDLV